MGRKLPLPFPLFIEVPSERAKPQASSLVRAPEAHFIMKKFSAVQ